MNGRGGDWFPARDAEGTVMDLRDISGTLVLFAVFVLVLLAVLAFFAWL